MDRPSDIRPPEYQWWDLVRLSSDDGARWIDAYRGCSSVAGLITGCLPVLRRGDLDAGRAMLQHAWQTLEGVEVDDPSIRSVLERWYYGALGYYHYVRNDYDEADRVMVQACDTVARVLRGRPFLLAVADEAVEIRFHRARIARNRQRWDEMHTHIQAVRDMRSGRTPLFEWDDHPAVWMDDVQAHFDGLPLPAEHQPVVPRLQVAEARRADTEATLRDILRIPGFVIQQP